MRPRPAGAGMSAKPMFAGLETRGLGLTSPSLTWDFIKRLRDVTTIKVVIKGLEAGEDAAAVEHGADGIIVSNHGGRATETGRGAIECVADVAQAVKGRVPILVDGGIRRGTDVFKALSLGTDAVGIGRPHIWRLATFGQQGVERVLDIINAELRPGMVGCTTPEQSRRRCMVSNSHGSGRASSSRIDRAHVRRCRHPMRVDVQRAWPDQDRHAIGHQQRRERVAHLVRPAPMEAGCIQDAVERFCVRSTRRAPGPRPTGRPTRERLPERQPVRTLPPAPEPEPEPARSRRDRSSRRRR